MELMMVGLNAKLIQMHRTPFSGTHRTMLVDMFVSVNIGRDQNDDKRRTGEGG
jgi:hypothetical protein